MDNDDLLRLYEEMLAVKAGVELDIITIDKVKPCLDEFYRSLEAGQVVGPLAILIERQYLSESQVSFLREGVLEDTCVFAPEIDITKRVEVEGLLGIVRRVTVQKKLQSRSCSVDCPHCGVQYRMEMDTSSRKLRCARCHAHFYLSAVPGSSELVVSKEPKSQLGGPFQALRTVSLSAGEMDRIGKKIFQQPKQREVDVPDDSLWNFEPEPNSANEKTTFDQGALKSLCSGANAKPPVSNESGDDFSTALWSSDQFDAIDDSEISGEQNSPKTSPSFDKMQDSEQNDMPQDLLKLPEEGAVNNFDLLNISSFPNSEAEAMNTLELDIRATPLFKKKPNNTKDKKPATKITSLSHEESLVVLKYAISYNFISTAESSSLLDIYYRSLSKGKKNDDFVSLLISEGYITKFQYNTLQKALQKDRAAERIPSLDMASRKQVDKFLGSGEQKKLMRISCPHCQTSFRVRVSARGGKFRCGKCHKSFFLAKK